MTGMVPLGRYGRVEEIAWAASFLAGPDASYVSGTTLNIHGGFGAGRSASSLPSELRDTRPGP